MIVLYNAIVLGLDSSSESHSAIAIQGEKIVAVGESSALLSAYGRQAQTLDMHQKVVWPGLSDAHLHLSYYALNAQKVDCETSTKEECLRRVGLKAQSLPAGEWILGHGWNQNDWQAGFGTAQELDAVSGDHPVYLTSKSIHCAWANSKALALAGISTSTPSLEGLIQKDAQGNPTGNVFESAMLLVEKVIPSPTLAQLKTAMGSAQQSLVRMGLTCVLDFDPIESFQAQKELQQEGKRTLRVIKGIPRSHLSQVICEAPAAGLNSDFLHFGPVKLFADGALGPRTAALFDPYEGETENRGVLTITADEILEIGQKAVPHGIALATHAIGDRAVHEVLEGYAQIRTFETQNHLPHLRHRIEHAQLLRPADFKTFADLHIIASMQPTHATSDRHMADRFWGERTRYAYAWKTFEDYGIPLAFGSDAPVESPNPFPGIYAAVSRCRLDEQPGRDDWHAEQALSLRHALSAFTTGPAFAYGMETQIGQLAPGFFADLIVLDQDPFTLPIRAVANLQPLATMVAGQWVWMKGDANLG